MGKIRMKGQEVTKLKNNYPWLYNTGEYKIYLLFTYKQKNSRQALNMKLQNYNRINYIIYESPIIM